MVRMLPCYLYTGESKGAHTHGVSSNTPCVCLQYGASVGPAIQECTKNKQNT